jgi:hypothetical protein
MGDRNIYILQKCLHRCNGLATKIVEIQWLPLTKIGFLMIFYVGIVFDL